MLSGEADVVFIRFEGALFIMLGSLNLNLANPLNRQLDSVRRLNVVGGYFEGDEVEADGAPVLAEPPDPEGLADLVVGALAAGDDAALVGGGDYDAVVLGLEDI